MIREVEGGSIENGVVKTNRRRFQSRGDANKSKAVEWSKRTRTDRRIDRSAPHRSDHRKLLVTVVGQFQQAGMEARGWWVREEVGATEMENFSA